MALELKMSPSPEQGPMFAVKVVSVVTVSPHPGLAKTEGREISVGPRTVTRIRTVRRIDLELFFKGKTSS